MLRRHRVVGVVADRRLCRPARQWAGPRVSPRSRDPGRCPTGKGAHQRRGAKDRHQRRVAGAAREGGSRLKGVDSVCRVRTIGGPDRFLGNDWARRNGVREHVMSGHRFRFRSAERDRETDERRFGLIRTVVRSAIADAEAEAKGLRVRIAEARRSAIFLVEHVGYGECAPTSRAALKTREEHLLAIERRLPNPHALVLEVALRSRGFVCTPRPRATGAAW
jgi:hypothetical protein